MRCVAADEWAGAARRGHGAVSRRYRQHALLSRGERAARRGLRSAAADLLRHVRAPRDPTDDRGWCAALCVSWGVLGGLWLWLWLALGAGAAGGVHVALPSLEHSVGALPFPAVALCDYTVISRAAAADYATHLTVRGQALGYNYTEREVYARLLHFSALLTLTRPPVDLEFTEFLRDVDGPRGGNVTEIMMHLSRGCEALAVCGWRGRRTPCHELFALRPTSLGFCCVFNSQYVEADRWRKPRVLRAVGPENGLFVGVTSAGEGEAGGRYRRRAAEGVELLVFPPAHYPLLEGGARALPAASARATHLVITARELRAPDELRSVPESLRGCRYSGVGDGYAWCLMRCRRAALQQLCGCVPFQLLPAPDDFVCSLNQLDCLNKYREKLLRYYPGEQAGAARAALREELSDAIDCGHCLPDCRGVTYSVTSFINEYYSPTGILPNHYSQGTSTSLRNASVLRLYYSTEAQRLYEIEQDWLWYERVGSLGGAVSLCGCALPLLLQLLYCGTLRCSTRARRHYRLHAPIHQ